MIEMMMRCWRGKEETDRGSVGGRKPRRRMKERQQESSRRKQNKTKKQKTKGEGKDRFHSCF
jgi:hypothetical protein